MIRIQEKSKNDLLENTNKVKVDYFFKNNLKVHIFKTNKNVNNGYFESDLIDNMYYEFKDDVRGNLKLFLSEIYELEEFKEF